MNVLALDDGYFPINYKGRRGYTVLLAVEYTTDKYSVVWSDYTFILVDGVDATDKALSLAREAINPNIVLYDGITYAGFNYIDPYRVNAEQGIPGIVFYRYKLSIERIRKALEKHFPDYMKRIKPIERALRERIALATKWGVYGYTPVGIEPWDAEKILRSLQLYSPEPEPLRIADQLASNISRLLLTGKRSVI